MRTTHGLIGLLVVALAALVVALAFHTFSLPQEMDTVAAEDETLDDPELKLDDVELVEVTGDNDFEPVFGETADGPGDYGPWNSRLMIAYSDDGLNWERTNQIVSDQADVPDLAIDEDGTLYLYYTAWELASSTVVNTTHVAISEDNGETWTFKFLELNGIEENVGSALVDPDIHILEDGTFRLFLTYDPHDDAGARSHVFESEDGIHFDLIGEAFSATENRFVLDPSALQVDDGWIIFAGGGKGNWYGTSDDGLTFTSAESVEIFYDGRQYMMANGIVVDDGYRFYTFANGQSEIVSFWSDDGVEWEGEQIVLDVDESSGLESEHVKDPAVIQLANGTYMMIYKTTMP